MTESAPTDDPGAKRASEREASGVGPAEGGAGGETDAEARSRAVTSPIGTTDSSGPVPKDAARSGPSGSGGTEPAPGSWVANQPEAFGGGANPAPPGAPQARPAPGAWEDAPAGLPPGPPPGGGFTPGPYPPAYPAYQPAPYPGGYPPAGQLPPEYPVQNVGPARPTNALAIVSLVLGILGLVLFFGVASIPAVITGHIARRQIRQRDEDGAGIALAGLILGWIGVALVVLFIGFFVVLIGVGAFATSSGHP